MKFKLVSFYCDTDDSSFYKNHANNLITHCEKNNIDYCIEGKKYGEDWISNVQAKPIFLKEMLNKFDCDILWLDADCSIKGDIKSIGCNTDWGILRRTDGTPCDHVHYIKNTHNNKTFVNIWNKTIQIEKRGSHTAFISLFKKHLNVSDLPDDIFELKLSNTKSKKEYFG